MKRGYIYPKELEHLQKSLIETSGKVDALTQEIEDLKKGQGPRPEFKLAGGPPSNNQFRREKRMETLAQEKAQLITDYNAQIEPELNKLDTKMAIQVKAGVEFQLSENQFKNRSKEELEELAIDEKHGDSLFDYQSAIHFQQFMGDYEDTNPDKYDMDAWQQDFMDKLSYPEEIDEDSLSFDKDDINIEEP